MTMQEIEGITLYTRKRTPEEEKILPTHVREMPKRAPRIESATAQERFELENDCKEILSTRLTRQGFNSYVDNMIKILGSGGTFTDPGERQACPVYAKLEDFGIGLDFKQSKDGEYIINTIYINEQTNDPYPDMEHVMLNDLVPDMDKLLKVEYVITDHKFPKKEFKSIAIEAPESLNSPLSELNFLDHQQSQIFLKNTFGIYKLWNTQKILSIAKALRTSRETATDN